MPNPRTDAESDAEPNTKSDAEPDREPDAEPDAKPYSEPDVESHAKPDVCTDQLQCFGVGQLVELQRGVWRRIRESHAIDSRRITVRRRLPGGESSV